jgi:hypothetical protein
MKTSAILGFAFSKKKQRLIYTIPSDFEKMAKSLKE